jgi:hypothetical protein
MKLPRQFISLFLVATVLCDLAAMAAQHYFGGSSGSVALMVLFFSQVILSAIWLALGRSPAPFRVVVVFFLLIEWNMVLYWMLGTPDSCSLPDFCSLIYTTPFTIIITGIVAIPLLFARILGLQLVDRSSKGVLEDSATEARPGQFSILYMFGLMTVLAIVLGMTQFTFLLNIARIDIATAPRIQMHALLHGFIGLAALIVIFGREWLPRWVMISLIVGALLFAVGILGWYISLEYICSSPFYYQYYRGRFVDYLYYMTPFDKYNFYSIPQGYFIDEIQAIPFGIEALLVLGSLYAFRRAGYRAVFCWRWKAKRDT